MRWCSWRKYVYDGSANVLVENFSVAIVVSPRDGTAGNYRVPGKPAKSIYFLIGWVLFRPFP
jgi:hypothetical protein